MKILFDNVLKKASSITSTYESANYPATNLTHAFLHTRFQSLVSSDTITAEWDADQTIDCVFAGYTNASGFTIRFYNAADSLLDTVVTGSDYTAQYLDTQLTTVRSIQIDIASSDMTSAVYLGGVGLGTYTDMNTYMSDNITDGSWDNSVNIVTPFGQSSQTLITPGAARRFNFSDMIYSQFIPFKNLFNSVGSGALLWVDFFEESHTEYPALYCRVSFSGGQRTGIYYSYSVDFQEAR